MVSTKTKEFQTRFSKSKSNILRAKLLRTSSTKKELLQIFGRTSIIGPWQNKILNQLLSKMLHITAINMKITSPDTTSIKTITSNSNSQCPTPRWVCSNILRACLTNRNIPSPTITLPLSTSQSPWSSNGLKKNPSRLRFRQTL